MKKLHGLNQTKGRRRNPLYLARKMKELLETGEVATKAEIAQRYGWSRARVTQIMNLLKLPKEIQAVLLDPTNQGVVVSERALRPLLKCESPMEREKVLAKLGF